MGIICGRLWGSFAVDSGDHLRPISDFGIFWGSVQVRINFVAYGADHWKSYGGDGEFS